MRTVTDDNRIDELEQRIDELEQAVFEEERDIRGQKKMSLAEFLKECDASDYTEKAVAIGYFLEKYDEVDTYTTADIQDSWRRAKMQQPGNLHDVVRRASSNGHLMDSGENDGATEWTLTQSGIDYVEEELLNDDD